MQLGPSGRVIVRGEVMLRRGLYSVVTLSHTLVLHTDTVIELLVHFVSSSTPYGLSLRNLKSRSG